MRLNHPDFLAYLVLAGYTVLAHGLLLLYDGVYNDGWLYYTYLSEARWDLLGDFFLKQGIPHTIYLYRLLALFPDFLLAHKLFAFGSLLAVGWLLYGLTQKLGWFTRGESVLLAAWSVGFPAYQYAQEISHSWNLLPYPLFLLGWWLALEMNSTQGRKTKAGLRLGALACLALSFVNPALLVFYFGFWLVWIGRIYQQQAIHPVQSVRRYPDFLLLPFAYWGLMRLLFPPHGIFADYNEINPSLLLDLNGWWQFVEVGVLAQLLRPFTLMSPLFLLLVAGLYLLLNRWRGWEERPFFRQGWRGQETAVFGIALLFLFLVVFPFIVVGKPPSLYGFDTRQLLLLGLPVALLLLAGLRLLFGGEQGRLQRVGGLLALLLLLGFALAQMESYLAWQARWVRDQSVRLNLADLPLADDQSIIYFADEDVLYRRDGRIDEVSQFISRRYFLDWTIMLRQVYGPTPGRVGIDLVYLGPLHFYYHWVMELREETLDPAGDFFFLAAVDPAGCQAIITIRPTAYAQEMSKLGLARRYWQNRFWRPAAQETFLRSLTHLSVEPLDAPQAVNCR
jgi:hypothetical protein